jgi:membrane protein required for colicin V production
MNIVDIILIIILVAGAVNGFIKGFFVEFASVAAIVLGVLCAMLFSPSLIRELHGLVSWSTTTIKIISYLVIFISVVIVVHVIAALLEKSVRAVALGSLSRVAGAIFGVVKTAFILSLLMYVIGRIESFDVTIIPKEPKHESKYYAPIEKLVPNLFPFLREETEESKKGIIS